MPILTSTITIKLDVDDSDAFLLGEEEVITIDNVPLTVFPAKLFPGDNAIIKACLNNPLKRKLKSKIIVKVPQGFKVSPAERVICLGPGENKELSISVKIAEEGQARYRNILYPIEIQVLDLEKGKILASPVVKLNISSPLDIEMTSEITDIQIHKTSLLVTADILALIKNQRDRETKGNIGLKLPTGWKDMAMMVNGIVTGKSRHQLKKIAGLQK